MATFKTCIFEHQRRKDGTYNIKLRITHHRKSRWISSTLYATSSDLTRGMKIKNEKLNRLCRELVDNCIDICNNIGYAIENMDVDELVAFITSKLKGGNRFHLDFFEYAIQETGKMRKGTASIYISAINALKRYIRRDTLDIQEIKPSLIKGFVEFIKNEPSQRGANRKQSHGDVASKGDRALSLYVSRIKTIYNKAKDEFNDEEFGQINISGNPFKNIHIETPPPTAKRAIGIDAVQKIINLQPFENDCIQMARDCFIISFSLMGMNSADMFSALPAKSREIIYFRQKTASRRADKAEMHVRIEPCIDYLIQKYADQAKKRLFNFYIKYKDKASFNKAINKGLKEVGQTVGVDNLTFYAARHSWATIARMPKEEGGAGLDKYIVHEA